MSLDGHGGRRRGLRGVVEGKDACEVTPIGGFAIEVDTLTGHIQRTFQANGVPKDIRDRLWRVAVITDFDQRVTMMETEVSDALQ